MKALAQSALACDHQRGRASTKPTTVMLASYCAAVESANRFIVRRHVWSIETFAVRPPLPLAAEWKGGGEMS